jgi:hypothetical protein
MYLPEWINKHKEPRTEIKKLKGRYYKYEVKYVYEKEKKRTVKKTVRLLGRLTEEQGFIPSAKDELRRCNEQIPPVDIKVYGLYYLYSTLMSREIELLKNTFDDETAGVLLSFSMLRWGYCTPIKRAMRYHSHDFISEELFAGLLSDKCITRILRTIGESREKVVEWMKRLLADLPGGGKHYVMMDSTHTQSLSENLHINAVGYNPDFTFEKQVRLMYLFSSQLKQPVYYRMLNGNITDVKSMALCIKEFGEDEVIYIADKGFYSKDNIEMLDGERLQYIIPLRRNNPLIDFSVLQESDFKRKINFFSYQNRIIWYYAYKKDNVMVITFLDEHLRVSEETDYLNRTKTHPENYSIENYYEKLSGFGTLSVVYNIRKEKEKSKEVKKKKTKEITQIPECQVIYETYKTRNEVEVMFDSYKNFLEADVAYMQNRYVMEGWLFANFIAMIAYYKLYIRLKQANMLSKFSPKDMIELAKSIYKLKCRGKWMTSEITRKTDDLFKKIGIDYLT